MRLVIGFLTSKDYLCPEQNKSLMKNNLTQKIEAFLAELSEKARSYYFPGVSDDIHAEGDSIFIESAEEYLMSKDMADMPMPRSVRSFSSSPDKLETEQELLGRLHDGDVHEYKSMNDYSAPRKRAAMRRSGRLFSLIHLKQKAEEDERPVADLELDERTKAIMEEFDALMKKYGLSVDEVEILLARRVKLSRLHITEKNEILLVDFDHREVKMDTLTKAVFYLYLRHPEGIRYKELSDHQQELEEIYSSITGREDLGSIRKSVEGLCDPLNNSINEKVSKVKKAFRDVVNDRVAKFYYIDGEKGTAKRIALDRDYVLWE